MVQTLRSALAAYLEGWRSDLAPKWRSVFDGTNPDLDAVDANLTFDDHDPIIPGRKHTPVPGAPPDAHVFRAFDHISPSRVSVVVVGQDPYPKVSRATGRSFEQGDLHSWPADQAIIADSLQRIVQVLIAARTGDSSYAMSDAAWSRVIDDLGSGALELEPPIQLFDRLQRSGVMFLNAGLTLTRFGAGGSPEQSAGHIPLWAPVIERVLRFLAERPDGKVVYVLWGAKARGVFDTAGVEAAARAVGSWGTQVAVVSHPHPNAQPNGAPFYAIPNPFLETNRLLIAMGSEPVPW